MCVRRLTQALMVVAFALPSLHAATPGPYSIDKAKTRVFAKDGFLTVSLAVVNTSPKQERVSISLDLIAPDDRSVCPAVEKEVVLAPGSQSVEIPFSFRIPEDACNEAERLPLLRIRYALSPVVETGSPQLRSSGILPISAVAPDLFDVAVSALPRTTPESTLPVQVYAAQPDSRHPVGAVRIEAVFHPDRDDGRDPLVLTGLTGSDGRCRLDLKLPPGLREYDQSLTVRAKGVLNCRTVKLDFLVLLERPHLSVTTDKPIYQPSQTLHYRSMLFDGKKRAMEGVPVTFTLEDGKGKNILSTTATTSAFGIASGSWPIPDGTRLGRYTLGARIEEENDFESESRRPQDELEIEISRYELPTFRAWVRPDRPYYLPGQSASVEIAVQTLAGAPLAGASVEVFPVRDENDYECGDAYGSEAPKQPASKGKTDAEGKCRFVLDLSAAHERLKGKTWRRFDDIPFAARVTDPATERVSQSPFTLRISHEDIHTYGIERQQIAGLPVKFYVSTFLADGTPLPCRVEIWGTGSSTDNEEWAIPRSPVLVAAVQTNRFGVARVSAPPLRAETEDLHLYVKATDETGRKGHGEGTIYFDDQPGLRLEAERIFLRPGEPIRAKIDSTLGDSPATVTASVGERPVYSGTVKLIKGETRLTIPYNRALEGEVTVAVYPEIPVFVEKTDHYNQFARIDHATVFYPRSSPIRAELSLRPDSARPGDPIEADIRVSTGDESSPRAALGIAVLDTAVEEFLRGQEAEDETRTIPLDSWFIRRSILHRFEDNDELSGITRESLSRFGPADPVPEGLDVVAEILLPGDDYIFEESSSLYEQAKDLFLPAVRKRLASRIEALDDFAEHHRSQYPGNEAAFRRVLEEAGLPFDDAVDPWGNPCRVEFSRKKEQSCFRISSCGPDGKPGSPDDIEAGSKCWNYPHPWARPLWDFLKTHVRDARQWLADSSVFMRQLRDSGLAWEEFPDLWGHPYRLELSPQANKLGILVTSAGPDGIFEERSASETDDIVVRDYSIDMFPPVLDRIITALAENYCAGERFPIDQVELLRALRKGGIAQDDLKDLYGRPCFFVFKPIFPLPDAAEETPVFDAVEMWSPGADGIEETGDDVRVAYIAWDQIATRIYRLGLCPGRFEEEVGNETAAVRGTVNDPTGILLPGIVITAEHLKSGIRFTALTDRDGAFLFNALPAGDYIFKFEFPGFIGQKRFVRVRPPEVVLPDVFLCVERGEPITVSAESPPIATLKSTVSPGIRPAAFAPSPTGISTPRVRKEFPETLLWIPELVTDPNGQARIDFKLADNITLWKMMLVASTKDGTVETAENGITAALPFFVELDLPPVLTTGDKLDVPAIVRNHTGTSQDVSLRVEGGAALSVQGPESKDVRVESGSFARQVFGIRAEKAGERAAVRISATSAGENDTLERTTQIDAYGEEHVRTVGAVLTESAALESDIPRDALGDGLQAELTIFPSLETQLAQSLEGILKRPTGCAEQITSAAYANLLYLRLLKSEGKSGGAIEAKAYRSLDDGIRKLEEHQSPGGAFAFWPGREPRLLLTAYVFRFLVEAGEFAAVEPAMLRRAARSIVNEQNNDGTWCANERIRFLDTETTAYIAETLAKVLQNGRELPFETANLRKSLNLAIDALREQVKEGTCSNSYALACYAISAHYAAKEEDFRLALRLLEKGALRDGPGACWDNIEPTPFHGWGRAGRIETTALAVQAFALAAGDPGIEKDSYKDLARRGTVFLLSHKDHNNVWYSTQATAAVLETLLSPLRQSHSGRDGSIEVLVNGSRATSIDVPPAEKLTGPIAIDLTAFVQKGKNQVELRAGEQVADAAAYLTTRYFTPWQETQTAPRLFQVDFDKREPKVGEMVTCRVHVQGTSMRAYGMMIAEVGLPPGAEVDRQSLEAARKESHWAIESFDILPARVIFYLRGEEKEVSFSFAFRPRIGGKMVASPSVLYDYYNPDARKTVVPQPFRIEGGL